MSLLPQDVCGSKGERLKAYQDFAAKLLELDQGLDFKQAKRDWCYWLEESEFGLEKPDFDRAESAIDKCRDMRLLPIDFCLDDAVRAPEGRHPTYRDDELDNHLEHIWTEVHPTTHAFAAPCAATHVRWPWTI